MPVTIPLDAHALPAQHASAHSTSQPPSVHGKRNAKGATKRPTRRTQTLTVRVNDTVYSLARQHRSTVAAIHKANPRVNVRHLVPGTKLVVPVPTSAPQKASAPATPAPRKHTSHPPETKTIHVVAYHGTDAARGYPESLVKAGDADRKELATKAQPSSEQVRSMIVATAKRYGVSPTLALGIGWQESGFRQNVVSVCDAIGTMQVMPTTGEWASDLVGTRLDIKHAQDNITAGVTTLRFLTEHAKNQDEVIGAYYQGLDAMRSHGAYSDTKHYISSVKSHMKRFAH